MLWTNAIIFYAVLAAVCLIGFGECRRRPRPNASSATIVTTTPITTNENRETDLQIIGCYDNETGPDVQVIAIINELFGPFITVTTIDNTSYVVNKESESVEGAIAICVEGALYVSLTVRFEHVDKKNFMEIQQFFDADALKEFLNEHEAKHPESSFTSVWEHIHSMFLRSRVVDQLTKKGYEDYVGWFIWKNGPRTLVPGSIYDPNGPVTSTQSLLPVALLFFSGCVQVFAPFNVTALESILRTEVPTTSVTSQIYDTELQLVTPDYDSLICLPITEYTQLSVDIRAEDDEHTGLLVQQIAHVFDKNYQPPEEVDPVQWEQMKELFVNWQSDTMFPGGDGYPLGWFYIEYNSEITYSFMNGSVVVY